MPFGEFTLLKIPITNEECDHSDRRLSYLWQKQPCTICGRDYYRIKCTECDQMFTKCRDGGCNDGKMVKVES
jgi:hypothetical protein